MKKSILYGVGIGPGDPELLTIKAIRIIKDVDTIFAPFSTKNEYSVALNIISPYIKEGTEVIRLQFPMTRDKAVLQNAWKRNAEKIASHLNNGRNGAFITLGDPMTYSTFGYIEQILRRSYKEIDIEIVPGITSYHAAAATSKIVLAKADESFAVISGTMEKERLKGILSQIDSAAILKVYKNYKEIIEIISKDGLIKECVFVSKCGLMGEKIICGTEDIKKLKEVPPYLSLIILRKEKKDEDY